MPLYTNQLSPVFLGV